MEAQRAQSANNCVRADARTRAKQDKVHLKANLAAPNFINLVEQFFAFLAIWTFPYAAIGFGGIVSRTPRPMTQPHATTSGCTATLCSVA